MNISPARVLLIERFAEHGGAQTVLLDLLARLDRSTFDPRVAVLRDGPLVTKMRALGVPVMVLPIRRLRNLSQSLPTVRKLRSLITEDKIELVHANASHSFPIATAAVAGKPCGVVWHVHDPMGRPRAMTRRALLLAQRRALPDFAICTTPLVAERLIEEIPGLAPRCRIVVPGVDTEVLSRSGRPGIRTRLGIPTSARVITMWARFVTFKGHLDLVEATALLRNRNVIVLLCGTNPDCTIRQRIGKLGLDGVVRLPGYLDIEDKVALLHESTVVVHPSHWEPFGLPVIEAGAAGVPVVAADAIGPRMTVIDGQTGLLYPRGDIPRLARAIDELLDDPVRTRELGEAGRLLVNSRFTLDAMVNQIQDVWREVLRQSKPSA